MLKNLLVSYTQIKYDYRLKHIFLLFAQKHYNNLQTCTVPWIFIIFLQPFKFSGKSQRGAPEVMVKFYNKENEESSKHHLENKKS